MRRIRKAPLFLFILWMISSCVKHVDFNQVEDFSVEPVIKSSLVYFTLNQINFFDVVNSVEVVTPIDDVSGFTLLKNSFIRNNLLRAKLEFQINNQFDRRFTVNIQFLDDNNLPTHTFDPFIVTANNPSFKQIEEIEVANNQSFLSSTKVKVSIELSPSSNGSTIDPNQEQTLEFKSAGTFFLKT